MQQFQNISQFTKTRLTLSLWYTFILLLILVAFSVALSVIYNNDVSRIVLQQDFGNHVPKTLSKVEMRLVVAQVRELRRTSTLDMLIIDLVTLIVGAGLSYFLAGKTLQPIQKNMESQKQFVADASHELKSPVTNIQSACEVVLRSPTRTKNDYKEVLEQVHEQSIRLGDLINDLLSLSVLNAGTVHKMTKVCSLSGLVEKEVALMFPRSKKFGIPLQTHIMPNVHINGESEKIRQLVVILLDNAIKFTPKGGKISITVSHKPQPQILVQDSGIGIAPEKQTEIFKRFYQADDSHTGSGSGLGLAIAQSIMQLHNGTLSVVSQPGSGSTFICSFPRKS